MLDHVSAKFRTFHEQKENNTLRASQTIDEEARFSGSSAGAERL
jgi:hypothetical protein